LAKPSLSRRLKTLSIFPKLRSRTWNAETAGLPSMITNIGVPIVLALSVCFAGCKPDADMPLQKASPPPSESRLSVQRIGVFEDELAYDGKRGVYLIRDAATGREFIGISGIGISEVGSHTCGKNCTAKDDR
jgi:hypothetical protein